MIRLHDLAAADPEQRFSPYCWRVRMALKHKGLPFETLPWRFADKEAIAFSGQGRVPVLTDGDRTVFDSWQIAEYLDQAYPQAPALFANVDTRRHARFIKHWTESRLHSLVTLMIIADLHDQLDEKDKAYFRKSREQRLGTSLEKAVADRETTRETFASALTPLRLTLAEQPFVNGERPGFGDYIAFGMFQWSRCASTFPILLPDDTLHSWRERMLGLFDGYAASFPTAKGKAQAG